MDSKIRRDPNINLSIHLADEAEYVAQGWSIYRRGAKSLGVSKPKNHDALLEDRVWSFCYKLGYPVISGPRFGITYLRNDGSSGEKQVDVFAKDDETCLVVECKSRGATRPTLTPEGYSRNRRAAERPRQFYPRRL